MHAHLAQSDTLLARRIKRHPFTILVGMEIAHGIERDRLEKHDHPLLLARQPHAFAQHARRVRTVRRTGDDQPWNVAQHGNGIVVVEMTAEAFLITEPGDAHDHRIGVLPVREKRQGRRFAAQLIFRIVQIGQELNLRDRHETIMAGADGEPENGLLVEQSVDHPVDAKARLQLLRHAIDAALAADILARQQNFRMFQHQIGQCPIDDAAHRLRRTHRVEVGTEDGAARFLGRAIAGAAGPDIRNEARHDASGIRELRPLDRLGSDPVGARAGLPIDSQGFRRRQSAGLMQQAHRMQQRIVRLFRLHFVLAHVSGRHIGAGMAIEPHGAQMQERRFATRAHIIRRSARHRIGLIKIETVGGEVFKAGAVLEILAHPTVRCLHRNTDAIVLADEQQRQRNALIRRP